VEVRDSKALHKDSQNFEFRNPEKVKSFDKSQSFVECFGFQHFDSCEGKRSGFLVPELMKSRNVI
jgi:hypothetical protein